MAAVESAALVLAAIIVLRGAFTTAERMVARRLADRVTEDLEEAVIRHIGALGPVGLARESSGELRTVLTEGLDDVHAWFEDYLPQVALSALVPLLVAVAVFQLDLLSAVVLLVTAPLIPLFMVLIGRLAESHSQRQLESLGRLGAALVDLVQGLPTLAMMGRAWAPVERTARVTHDLRRATMSTLRLAFLSALALELLATLSTAVVAVEVGLRLLYGRMDFVHAFAVLLLAPEFYLPLRLLGQRFHSGMAGVVAAGRLQKILDSPSKSVTSTARGEMPRHPVLQLDGVWARYPRFARNDRHAWAVRDLCFALERGETLALVGASGAGKSTVLNLLLRFFQPTRGQILADGVDARAIDVEAWREQICWVPQQPWLLTGTVAENLRLGRPQATDDELREAAALAHADGFIDELPQGWGTPLGERGARLSGGQAQRVALARAFLRSAPIVLLDEPGAGLDAGTLAELDDSIERLLEGRSAIVIAHRLASVERADRVVVLDRGRVVDAGRPADVLARPNPLSGLLGEVSR